LADLVERQVDRARGVAVSHIHDLGAIPCERGPVGKREGSPQVVGGDHARGVHRVLRGTQLWGVAKRTCFEVEYRPAKLDRRRDDVDAPLHAGLTNRLCTKDAAVGFAEEELDVDGFRAREITHMVPGMEIDLFKISDASAPQPLFARAGAGNSQAKDAANGRALDSSELRRAPVDGIRSDTALPIRGSGERDDGRLASDHVVCLDGVADGPDVSIAGPHLIIYPNAAALANV